MRFVADHGFFQGVARQLVCLGHDVDWHFPWCDPGVGDPTVFLYALASSRIVLTEDRGFLAHGVVNERLNESMGIVVVRTDKFLRPPWDSPSVGNYVNQQCKEYEHRLQGHALILTPSRTRVVGPHSKQ